MLDADELDGGKVTRGGREVWSIPLSAVQREQARRARSTLKDLASELAMGYHPLWTMANELGLLADRPKGDSVRLTDAQAQALRDEVDRRAQVASAVLPVASVALQLGVPETTVQTLIRREVLIKAPGPNRSRLTCVTVESVEAYEQRYLRQPAIRPDELVVPVRLAQRILGESRHGMTHLVCSRQLAVTSVGRRQCIGVDSLHRYLEQHPREGAADLIAQHSIEQRSK
jgi:hypothetical protein